MYKVKQLIHGEVIRRRYYLSVEDISIPSPRDDDSSAGETQLRVTTSAGIIQYAIYNSPDSDYYCDHSHATFLQVFDTVENSTL